jgi:hypothetical protein
MWILVLLVCINTCDIDSVPGAYTTLEKCREAAEAANEGMPVFGPPMRGLCIPAPDGLYENFE